MDYCSDLESAIDNVKLQISTNFTDMNFNVMKLPNKSGYSEDYIRAKFKQRTAMTPVEFLNNQRIAHAVRLIEIYSGKITVSRLSTMCGYADSCYFSNIFKKIKGISPKKYASLRNN